MDCFRTNNQPLECFSEVAELLSQISDQQNPERQTQKSPLFLFFLLKPPTMFQASYTPPPPSSRRSFGTGRSDRSSLLALGTPQTLFGSPQGTTVGYSGSPSSLAAVSSSAFLLPKRPSAPPTYTELHDLFDQCRKYDREQRASFDTAEQRQNPFQLIYGRPSDDGNFALLQDVVQNEEALNGTAPCRWFMRPHTPFTEQALYKKLVADKEANIVMQDKCGIASDLIKDRYHPLEGKVTAVEENMETETRRFAALKRSHEEKMQGYEKEKARYMETLEGPHGIIRYFNNKAALAKHMNECIDDHLNECHALFNLPVRERGLAKMGRVELLFILGDGTPLTLDSIYSMKLEDLNRLTCWCKNNGISASESLEGRGQYLTAIPRLHESRIHHAARSAYVWGWTLGEILNEDKYPGWTKDVLKTALHGVLVPEDIEESYSILYLGSPVGATCLAGSEKDTPSAGVCPEHLACVPKDEKEVLAWLKASPTNYALWLEYQEWEKEQEESG
mmetsp:Transcript_2293/g.3778  ORF Transcript_2293/g.3778 Transcript_2293/m.3778 type:complete len:505 (-) Transcript_2293:77-1591(-)